MDLNTIANLGIAISGIGTLAIAIYMVNKKTKTQVELKTQPVKIQIEEELYEQFASKHAFEMMTNGNTSRHNEIFSRIESVSREMAEENKAIRKEVAEENKSIRKDIEEKFFSIQRLLGRIEQKINSK